MVIMHEVITPVLNAMISQHMSLVVDIVIIVTSLPRAVRLKPIGLVKFLS